MSRTLSEADSKARLSPHGVPFAPERLVSTPQDAVVAAQELGFPVAAKLCGENVAHKTERGLVRLALADPAAVARHSAELLDAARPDDQATGVLIAPMIVGERELIAGVSNDEQFGATVLLGVGGVLTEVMSDVAIRLAPITRVDAAEMIDQLRSVALFDEFRGEPPIDREAVIDVLLALSDAAAAHQDLVSIDLNPLVISNGQPVAVDALVEVRS